MSKWIENTQTLYVLCVNLYFLMKYIICVETETELNQCCFAQILAQK